MEITDNERKRLLHAYETLMFKFPEPPNMYGYIFHDAWTDILTILKIGSLQDELHGGGEWLGEDLHAEGHWDCLK